MLAAIRRQASHPFWVLVGLRLAFLLLTACTLLWSPLHTRVPVQRAYNGTTDLLFGSFDRWDAENFIYIARHGYNTLWTAAFFPLFPLALAGAHAVFRSYTVGGVLISLVAAGFGAWAVYEIARPLLGERGARDSVLYLALFPTAFVFTSPYSEGLFLALSAAAFLAALRGRPWLAALAGALAVDVRSLGFALIVPLVYLLWPRERREWWRPLPALVALPAAVGGYALYLHYKLGDALAFDHAQKFWNRAHPTLGPLGGLKDALESGLRSGDLVLRHLPRGMAGPAGYDKNMQDAFWNAIHLPIFLAAVALTVVAWRRLGRAFGLYSAATLVLILNQPPTNFPLQSLPRYLLCDFPILIALAALTLNRPAARTWVIASFAAVGAIAGVAFARDTIWIT